MKDPDYFSWKYGKQDTNAHPNLPESDEQAFLVYAPVISRREEGIFLDRNSKPL
jgi:hypothetical protein